jgi:hypothetical protein
VDEVMDKPRTVRRSVVLGRRVAASTAGFHWYMAGRDAERRTHWMGKAREVDGVIRQNRVHYAREYHHSYMRHVARALELQS